MSPVSSLLSTAQRKQRPKQKKIKIIVKAGTKFLNIVVEISVISMDYKTEILLSEF